MSNKRIDLDIIDPSDMESEIIAQAKLFFGRDVDFCLLYVREDSGAETSGNGLNKYTLEGSTFGLRKQSHEQVNVIINYEIKRHRDNSGINLFTHIQSDWFGRVIYLSSNNEIRKEWDFCELSKEYGNWSSKSIVKLYKFDGLGLLFLNDFQYLLLLGFWSGLKSRQEFRTRIEKDLAQFQERMNEICKLSIYQQKRLDDWIERLKDKNYKTYGHIVQSFKKMLAVDEHIENIHLFLYDAYDRRLYYRYVDSMRLDKDALESYLTYCRNPNIDLKLSPSQSWYVKKKIQNILQSDDDTRAAFALLDNIHDERWMRNYFEFAESASTTIEGEDKLHEYREWILAQVLSCIPQEPWTGVAGYTALTKTIDISVIGNEPRWDPHKLHPAYFFSKLMCYERLVGIGGGGAMVAFPILDNGQIAGVLFATRRESDVKLHGFRDFSKQTLYKLYNLSIHLKYFIMHKRQFDFSMKVLRNLVNETDKGLDLIRAIGNYLPDLINPALVVVWEQDTAFQTISKRPRYIWGYNERNAISDGGFVPSQYQLFSDDDRLFSLLSSEHFEAVCEIYDKEILGEDDVNKTLSIEFRSAYERNIFDDITRPTKFDYAEKSNSINSAILLKYKIGDRAGWVVIYLHESEDLIKSQFDFISHKLDAMRFLLEFEKPITNLLNIKLASSHEIRSAFIEPMSTYLETALEYLEKELNLIAKKQNTDTQNIKNAYSLIRRVSRHNLALLKDTVARIDNFTVRSEYYSLVPINLVNVVRSVWEDIRVVWRNTPSIQEYQTYLKYGKCLVSYCQETVDILDEGNALRDLSPDLHVLAIEDQVYLAIHNLINNIFKESTLPIKLLNTEKERATFFVDINKLEAGMISIKIRDQGLGMNEYTKVWLTKVLEEVRATKGSSLFLSTKLHDEYNKNTNNKTSRHGFGIFNIARSIYSCTKEYSGGIPLITFDSIYNEGTTFTLLFRNAGRSDVC